MKLSGKSANLPMRDALSLVRPCITCNEKHSGWLVHTLISHYSVLISKNTSFFFYLEKKYKLLCNNKLGPKPNFGAAAFQFFSLWGALKHFATEGKYSEMHYYWSSSCLKHWKVSRSSGNFLESLLIPQNT